MGWSVQPHVDNVRYVGIVGVKSYTFVYFIGESHSTGNNIYDDKRKCLHLFQCYMEAKSDAEMPKTISTIFTDGNITLNCITLLPHHILSLMYFMSSSSLYQWKILALSDCYLRDIGMNSLLEHVIKNDESTSTLEYVDLSGNKSSPWGVYCVIIRHCCVSSLTLCGDEGIINYVKEITDSLQMNTSVQSLILCASIYRKGSHESMVLKASSTKKPQSIVVINGKLRTF